LKKTDLIITEIQLKKNQENALQTKINEEFIYLLRKRILAFIEEYFKNLDGYATKECDRLSLKIDSKLTELLTVRDGIMEEINLIDNTQIFEKLIKVFQTNYEKTYSNYHEEFLDLLKEKYLIAFKESNMEVFKLRLFDLINDVLIDNVDKREFPINENKLSVIKKSTDTLMQYKYEKKEQENKVSAINKSLDNLVQYKSEKKLQNSSNIKSREIKPEENKIETAQALIQKPLTREPLTNSHIEEKPITGSKNVIQEEEKAPKEINNREIPEKEVLKENDASQNPELAGRDSNSFEINVPDYFNNSPETKYLHFFEENSKNLFLLDVEKLEDPLSCFQKIELNIEFFIPLKSRSLATPKGLIYLLGGYYNKGSTNTFLYDSFNQSLQPKANMNLDRETFGVTYLLNQIYVCGGNDEYGNKLNSCERYDFFSNTWTKIAPLNQKASGLYLTTFNDKYIYKFGGESTQTLLSQIIEVYELKSNKWSVIQAMSESNLVPVISRLGACVQINEQNIFIFGGYYAKNDAGTNQSFLLETSEKEKQKYIIKRLNEKLLTHCAGFWSNMPIVHKKRIICLQNVPDPDNTNVSLQDKRRVMVFDSKEWKKFK